MFTCSQCPTSFKNKTSLKEHVVKHLIWIKIDLFSIQVHVDHMFTCSQCPTSFKNKTSLKEHVVKHHIGIKNFSCDTCGKEFYSKQNLRVVERLFMVQTKVTFLFGQLFFPVFWIRIH
jgi:hypothetical protein